MSGFGGEWIVEADKQSDADEESQPSSNLDEGNLLLLLFEVEIGYIVISGVIPIFSELIALSYNWVTVGLPARWSATSKMVSMRQIA